MVILANWREFFPCDTLSYSSVQSCYLVWCKSGHGRFFINDKEYFVAPGDFFYIPWNHSISYAPDSEKPYLLGCIHIIPDMRESGDIYYNAFHSVMQEHKQYHLRFNEEAEGLERVFKVHLTEASPLLKIAEYIIDRYQRQCQEALLRLFPQLLLTELQEAVAEQKLQRQDYYPPPMRAMLNLIDRFLEAKLKLWMLMKAANRTAPSVYRAFKRWFNMTPNQFIMKKRLCRAAHILRSDNISILEISARLDFSSPFYFSRCFKAEFGVSPRQYRNQPTIPLPLVLDQRIQHEYQHIKHKYKLKFFPEKPDLSPLDRE